MINQSAEYLKESEQISKEQAAEPVKTTEQSSGQTAGPKPGNASPGARRYGLFGVSAYPERQGMEEEPRQSMSRWAGGVILFLMAGVMALLLMAGSGSKGLTVTFDSQGGSEAAVQSVPFGGTVEEPDPVARPGYVMKGWSVTPDGSQPWDFDQDTVTEALTLYAVWEADPG